MKKKLLLVTRNFPPLVGGMERLNLQVSHILKKYYDLSVSGPKGSASFHGVKNFVEFSVGPLWKYIATSLLKTFLLAYRAKPDIIFCGSGAAILSGYVASRITSSKLVCYLHGLDIVVENPIYQWCFVPLIKKSDLLLVNSHHTFQLAVNAGIPPEKLNILFPGVSMPDLTNRDFLEREFRAKYDLERGGPLLLIAGRLTERKGIAEFIKFVMPKLVEQMPSIQLLVIGAETTAAMLHHVGVKDKIIGLINELQLHNNIKLLGGVDDTILSAAFFTSDLFVFPVLNLPNDVEGFGMVAIEAASHGLPTVGFAVGGIPDAIMDGQSGWLIESGNYQKMQEQIVKYLKSPQLSMVTKDSCIEVSQQFLWSVFERKMTEYLAKV